MNQHRYAESGTIREIVYELPASKANIGLEIEMEFRSLLFKDQVTVIFQITLLRLPKPTNILVRGD